MGQSEQNLSSQDFFWALASACQLHRIPFDAGLALERFPPPYERSGLILALGAFGVEAESQQVGKEGAGDRNVPCIAFFQAGQESEAPPPTAHQEEGAEEGGSASSPLRPALIIEVGPESLTYFTPDQEQPQTLSTEDFGRYFQSQVVKLHPAEDERGVDDEDTSATPFGFRWFIPELLRYKPIWRDVLLASLFIQVLGLATPLFTQVIIDKAIVHEALNTLAVIAVALFMFMVFSSVMTWVRQYLII
ncbi:peptidase domain-containing ABC transporter, partial [Thiohalorhabdus sp. Cl-TMA]